MASYWCDTFLPCHSFPFLNLRTFTLLLSPLLLFPTCSYFDIAVVSLASRYTIRFATRTSLFFLPVRATVEAKERSRRDEDWLSAWRQCLRWSIAPCILDRCGPINRYQVDHVVPDDRKKKRLFSSSSTGVLSSIPPIFDAFGRDLFHVLRLKLDDLRHRRLYFDLILFPYFFHFRRYGR